MNFIGGSANNTTQTIITNKEKDELIKLIGEVKKVILQSTDIINAEEKEDVIIDIESLEQQISLEKPKENIIKKNMRTIKNFIDNNLKYVPLTTLLVNNWSKIETLIPHIFK